MLVAAAAEGRQELRRVEQVVAELGKALLLFHLERPTPAAAGAGCIRLVLDLAPLLAAQAS